jgi:superfamily II DNA/RNA helicase
LARGIDVQDIDLIIMYSPSAQTEQYVHRCGRTGRAGKEGLSLCLYTPSEEEMLNKLLKKS